MEIGLRSKINRLITPFQASGSGTLGVLITFDVEVVCVVMAIIFPSWTELPRDELCFGLRLQVMLLPWQHHPKWQIKGPCEGFVSAVEVFWKCFEIFFFPADIEIFVPIDVTVTI